MGNITPSSNGLRTRGRLTRTTSTRTGQVQFVGDGMIPTGGMGCSAEAQREHHDGLQGLGGLTEPPHCM